MVSTTKISVHGYRRPARYRGRGPPEPLVTRRRCKKNHQGPFGPPKALLAPLQLSNSALPPEIRVQIYKYALGGNIIFFDTHDSGCTGHCSRKKYHCRAYVAEQSGEEFSNQSDSVQVEKSLHHPRDSWKPLDDVDLELLLTCRQIYNEAVLVPFSANEFAFDSDWFRSEEHTKILFLKDLIPDQSRAISTLHIWDAVRYAEYRFEQQHISALSGLRRLKVRFVWDMRDIRGSPARLMSTLENRFRDSGVSIFATAQLRRVDIKINLTVFYRDVSAVMSQKVGLIDWIKSKQAFLLTRQSPPRRRGPKTASQTLRTSGRVLAQGEDTKTTAESEGSEQRSS